MEYDFVTMCTYSCSLCSPTIFRFHQIRRHLNGISHPVVGDSVHGSSRFNRELVGHPNNPAPAGRLLLHCLRLELPTLPHAGSTAWRTGTAAADDQQVGEDNRRGEDGSEEARQVDEVNGKPHRQNVSDSGWTPPFEPDEEVLSGGDPRSSAGSGVGLCTEYRDSPTSSSFVKKLGGAALSASTVGTEKATGEVGGSDEATCTKVEGLDIYAEPPDDMLAFLRGMSWWEGGLIQAAERSGRRTP